MINNKDKKLIIFDYILILIVSYLIAGWICYYILGIKKF